MSDQIPPFDMWEAIKALFMGLFALLGWQATRQIKRIDKMEENYVDEHDYNETIKALRAEIKDGFEKTHARIDQLLLRDKDR